MGEAKRKKLASATTYQAVEDMFRRDGVDTSQFEFYDSDAFLAKERLQPEYLGNYAKWVLNRPHTAEYDARAKVIVPRISSLIAQAFAEDSFEGSCISATAMVSRILDRLGVWSFGIAGSAVFEIPNRSMWRGLHSVDFEDFPGAALGHAWVCAPPFQIVDASVRMQNWGNDPIKEFLPDAICAEDAIIVKPQVRDIVAAKKREQYGTLEGRLDPKLHFRLEPGLKKFGSDFPARQVQLNELVARYTPVAIRQSDVPLYEVNETGNLGRNGREIWEQIISPEIPALESKLGESFSLR